MNIKLSIIIPCFNEEKTLRTIIEKVKKFSEYEKEIIIIDDCSIDKTSEIIKSLVIENSEIKTFKHNSNLGKGRAVRTGIENSSGNIIIIQDADLEYDPKDYSNLLKPFVNNDADVVYGTRFRGGNAIRLHFFWHYLANRILTLLTNIVTNLNMSDMETGYKVFKKNVLDDIILKENSFGFEPEITVKLAKKNFIFYEVPISYYGRSYSEGKKITFKDALIAVYCIFKYRFFN